MEKMARRKTLKANRTNPDEVQPRFDYVRRPSSLMTSGEIDSYIAQRYFREGKKLAEIAEKLDRDHAAIRKRVEQMYRSRRLIYVANTAGALTKRFEERIKHQSRVTVVDSASMP